VTKNGAVGGNSKSNHALQPTRWNTLYEETTDKRESETRELPEIRFS